MGNIEVYCLPPACLPPWLDPIAYARVRERAVVERRRGSCKGDNKAQTRLAASFIFILGSLILNINQMLYLSIYMRQSYHFNPIFASTLADIYF